jgi:DNA gyrase subunit A
MATNIPPHNLGEVIDGCLALIDNPELTVDELMQYIPAGLPDRRHHQRSPGIIEAYRTGRGRIYMRARSRSKTSTRSVAASRSSSPSCRTS